MNPFIPRLLRLRYAANMIAGLKDLRNNNVEKKIDERDIFVDETKLPLYEEKNGRRRALNGKYVARIFLDIGTVTNFFIKELNLRKRIMGVYGNIEEYQPDGIYRDVIVKYVGLGNWSELEKNAESLCQMIELHFLDGCYSSLQGAIPPRESINPKKLHEGDGVELSLNDGAALTLEYLGEYRFKVKGVSGLSLKVKDVLEIHVPFIFGNRIYAESLSHSKKDLGEYLGVHKIIDLRLIAGPELQKEHLATIEEILAKAEEKRRKREANARERMGK